MEILSGRYSELTRGFCGPMSNRFSSTFGRKKNTPQKETNQNTHTKKNADNNEMLKKNYFARKHAKNRAAQRKHGNKKKWYENSGAANNQIWKETAKHLQHSFFSIQFTL